MRPADWRRTLLAIYKTTEYHCCHAYPLSERRVGGARRRHQREASGGRRG